MKKSLKAVICLILAIGLLSSFASASAVFPRSSMYIGYYTASISAGQNGAISITARVVGKGSLDEIGVSSITIYESSDGKSYTKYGTFYSDDYPSMMGSGSVYEKKAFEFMGTVGYTYKATVNCYGRSGSGSDTKPYSTGSVTAKR